HGVADWIHLDIMDGHFVPNLTFGPPVVAALRPYTKRVLDCHLMVNDPLALLPALAVGGADIVTLHIEAVPDPTPAIAQARELGLQVGLALRPATPIAAILPWLDTIDVVMPMTVDPGFGGQKLKSEVFSKVAAIRQTIDELGRPVAVQMDGGVTLENLRRCL